MNHFLFSAFLASVTTFILGIFIISRNPRSKLYRIYGLYCFSIALWTFCVSRHTLDLGGLRGIIYGRLLHVGAILIQVFFLHFVFVFLNIYEKKKRPLFITYLAAVILMGFNLFSTLLVEGVGYSSTISYTKAGAIYPFFCLYAVWSISYGIYSLFKAYKKVSATKRNQIKYLLFGSIIGYIGGVDKLLISYNIQISPFYPFGTYSIPIYVSIIAYSILKYRLMDITVAITRTGIFVAVYTLVLGLPFAVAVWLKTWLITLLGPGWWMLPLGLMAVLATVGPFIYIYIDRKAEERLLREQKRYQDTLKQASVGMTRIRNLRKLLDLITHIVTKTVKISYAAIYLYDQEKEEYSLQVSRDKNRQFVQRLNRDNPLINWIILKREPLVYEEVKHQMHDTNDAALKYLEEEMRILGAMVVIPSFLENKFLGFIVLGEKLSGQIYTPEDLNVFQVLASQAALAIENAQFYEETKEMQEQIAQAEKMATVGTMADGLSHQINNRFHALSLIAGDTIDTIKMTDTTKCTPEVKEMIGQISHALDRIQANVIQGGEVVKGILKYTRKGEQGFEALDLDEIIDGTLEMVQYKVRLSEIDIVRDYPKDIPKIQGNIVQLQEAFFNFIDNAYDAIMERRSTLKEDGYRGKVTISAQAKDSRLQITIQDNGIGVKEEDIKKVFTPFFTTKISSRKGTGLGLYVVRRIVTDTHRGSISFESEYKVGTRFILELPIAR